MDNKSQNQNLESLFFNVLTLSSSIINSSKGIVLIRNEVSNIFDVFSEFNLEETSIKKAELIKELDGSTTYELPDHLLGIIWKGKYRGQKQKWFLMRFIGDEKEINIKTKNPEFLDWKWIEIDQITEVVVDFKLHVYKELKEKIKKIIN